MINKSKNKFFEKKKERKIIKKENNMKQAFAAGVLALTCLVILMSLERTEARPVAKTDDATRIKEEKTAAANEATNNKNKNTKSRSNNRDVNEKRIPTRMDMKEANKYGLMEHRLSVCALPEFVADNSDLFDSETKEVNIRDVVKYWKLLHKQMMLRYGANELELALAGLPSSVRFDEVDTVFFELREYILCLAAAQN